jgi:peptidoglycan hydrolase-like protein with peptidoglycan-binding domain
MKKRTLKEEIERIRTITYGKNVLFENDFLNTLVQGVDNNVKPYDDPEKADFVDDNVRKFLNDLKSIDHEVSEQKLGTMEYQKEVELIQIGLVLLGYELPVHGIDGLFGPETATAVRKYKTDNNIVSEGYIGGGNVKIESDVDTDIDPKLMSMIDAIASEYGKSFTITSGYRDPKRNQNAGGADKSEHLNHKAVDVILDDTSIESTLAFVSISSKNGISGIGVYRPGKVHIDIGSRRYWGPDHHSGSLPSWAKSTIQAHMNNSINGDFISDYDGNSQDTVDVENEKVSLDMIKSMSSKLESKGVTKEELDKLVDKVSTGGGDIFTDLDLTIEEDYKTYAKICELYIKTKQPNPLGITGIMLADGAKAAFIKHHKYVPPELACAQLAAEGGIGDPNTNNKPVRTRNPFDIANTDDGKTRNYPTIQGAIDAYFNLIAGSYLGKGKTSNDLIYNFVNHEKQRYAKEEDYEDVVTSIAKRVRKIAQTVENSI